jgi:hypothetical protein
MTTRTRRPNAETTITIERDGIEIEVDVAGVVIPGEPMVAYYRDGSGYPGSDPEVDEVWVTSPADIELTEEEIETASDALLESQSCIEDGDYDPPEYDHYDCEYDR